MRIKNIHENCQYYLKAKQLRRKTFQIFFLSHKKNEIKIRININFSMLNDKKKLNKNRNAIILEHFISFLNSCI